MSVSGLSGSGLFELLYAENGQNQSSQGQSSQPGALQQIEADFTQLGQDLQSGNLTQAQQDFATLSSALSSLSASPAGPPENGASANSTNPIQQAFSALQQDLQNGNLSAAQQDFATLQQDLQQAGTQTHHHHHHHQFVNPQQASAVQQDFSSLAQALQSGNLSSAQTAFASLQNDLQNFVLNGPSGSSSSTTTSTSATNQSSSSGLNVTA